MNVDSLAELIGPSPPRCPLNPTELSAVDCGVYVRQLVEYAVEEAERIKSLLLLPKNAGRTVPAVIAHHQHAGQFDLGRVKSSVSPAIQIKPMVPSLLNAAMS